LADPILFLSHVITYGTVEDLAALRGLVDKQEFCAVLDRAPPGVFDARSWAYWNLICGRAPDARRSAAGSHGVTAAING
jgi:hypothetical protein